MELATLGWRERTGGWRVEGGRGGGGVASVRTSVATLGYELPHCYDCLDRASEGSRPCRAFAERQ